MIIPDYRPAPHVLDRLRQVDFVAVIGPTAVGKTTLIARAMAQTPQLQLVLVNTTRPPRPGEQDGIDYWFRDRSHMEARIAKGEYAQVAPNVLGELYATAPEDYPTSAVSVMAVLADAMPMFRALPFRQFRSIFVVPPSWEEWQARMASHQFTPEQRAKRLTEAQRSFEFALADNQTKLVISQDLSTATQDFIVLATGQPLSERLAQDQDRARGLVRNLLAKL